MKSLVLGLLLFSQYALAGDIFAKVTPEQPVCYGREYSTAHLKSAPKQTVQKFQAKLEKNNDGTKIMSVEVTLKGHKHQFTNYRAYFVCEDNNRCYIECDGGSVQLSKANDGRLAIENNNFVLEGGCDGDGETETRILEAIAGGDDKFLLTELPAPFCQNVSE
ncbi:hypothetical protein [Bdellovibrio sp. HCB337]|uniref:hypothetical protein n=1 Tax=Bdellovibrio sp. HCB337 TaxID=3394358 RepID=UPI0039A5415A